MNYLTQEKSMELKISEMRLSTMNLSFLFNQYSTPKPKNLNVVEVTQCWEKDGELIPPLKFVDASEANLMYPDIAKALVALQEKTVEQFSKTCYERYIIQF